MLFGSQATVDQHSGNPGIQVHGPGYSKILVGEDEVDHWEKHLDIFVSSIALNSGRSCINCSGIWVPRHGKAIAEAIAQELAKIEALPPEHPEASLAAFTVPGVPEAVSAAIDADLEATGSDDLVQNVRGTPRAITREHCGYLLPTLAYCASPEETDREERVHVPRSRRWSNVRRTRCWRISAPRWSAAASPKIPSSSGRCLIPTTSTA